MAKGDIGTRLDPREMQKKSAAQRKKNGERRAAIMAAFSSDGMTAQDAALFDRMLLMATRKELRAIAKNEDLPLDIRTRARALMETKITMQISTGEVMRDRAFGKPKQTAEIDGSLNTEQKMVFVGIPSPEND